MGLVARLYLLAARPWGTHGGTLLQIFGRFTFSLFGFSKPGFNLGVQQRLRILKYQNREGSDRSKTQHAVVICICGGISKLIIEPWAGRYRLRF